MIKIVLQILKSDLLKKRIRVSRIEDLVAGHYGDKVLGFAEIDDVVGPAGDHVDGFDLITGYLKFYGSKASGRSVEVRIQTAAIGCPIDR